MMDADAKYFTLITGASSGIGRSLAIECAKRGQNLFLVALPGDDFERFAIELGHNYNIQVECLGIDLTTPDAPQKIYDYSVKSRLNVNILINNAGNGHVGKFEEMKQEKVDEMINLNLRALTLINLLFINKMRGYEKAQILNVGSLGAYTPIAFKSVYIATKSYVYYFTRSLQQEYRNTNIKFSVLMPGAVVTNGEVEARIKNAGFFGKMSSLTPEFVAKYTLKSMDEGRFSILPGYGNRAIFRFSACIPSGFLLYITRKVFAKTH